MMAKHEDMLFEDLPSKKTPEKKEEPKKSIIPLKEKIKIPKLPKCHPDIHQIIKYVSIAVIIIVLVSIGFKAFKLAVEEPKINEEKEAHEKLQEILQNPQTDPEIKDKITKELFEPTEANVIGDAQANEKLNEIVYEIPPEELPGSELLELSGANDEQTSDQSSDLSTSIADAPDFKESNPSEPVDIFTPPENMKDTQSDPIQEIEIEIEIPPSEADAPPPTSIDDIVFEVPE